MRVGEGWGASEALQQGRIRDLDDFMEVRVWGWVGLLVPYNFRRTPTYT